MQMMIYEKICRLHHKQNYFLSIQRDPKNQVDKGATTYRKKWRKDMNKNVRKSQSSLMTQNDIQHHSQ